MQLLDWDEIVLTDEYAEDVLLMSKIIVLAIANEAIVNVENEFVQSMSHFLAVQRYMIRHIPDIKDLEKSAYYDLIAQEIGFNIPTVEGFPLDEFLRENKRWFGHKGTEILYSFLGELIGSPIDIYYPQDLIFKLDSLRSRLSGGASDQGVLPFKQSKLARFRDGRFYARFTYVVDVLQGQLVTNWNYLNLILDSIHPAGLKRFLKIRHWHLEDLPASSLVESGAYKKSRLYFYALRKYRGLSNGFRLSDPNSCLDQLFSFSWVGHTWIRQTAPARSFNYGYRVIAHDSFMHVFPEGYPDEVFYKWGPGVDGAYQKVYADQDGEILTIQQTNMSLNEIPYGEVKNLTLREMKNIALGNRGKNPSTTWYRDIPNCTIVERP